MSFRSFRFLLACLVTAGALTSTVHPAAPNLINYQGRLTNSAGQSVADGSYSVNFTIYDDPTGGVPQWGETQSVTTSNGLFTVRLGSVVFFGADLFNDTALYLAIKVGVDPEISPRTRLTAVPYALSSGDGWSHEGATVHLTTNTDAVGIGTSTPIRLLHVSGSASDLFVSRIESSHPDATVTEVANSSSGAVWESAVAGANGIGFWGIQPGDHYIYKQGNFFPSMVFTSGQKVGIGTAAPAGVLDVVGVFDTIVGYFRSETNTNFATAIKGHYTGVNPNGIGVVGYSLPSAGQGTGGYFWGGYSGITAVAAAGGSGDSYGVLAQADGPSTGSKHGLHASAGGSGKNYAAYLQGYGGTDTSFGAYAEAYGNNARGLMGVAKLGNYMAGVHGRADGQTCAGGYFRSNNVGVWSFGYASGEFSTVYGGSFNAFTTAGNISYGVYANASGLGPNVAIKARAIGGSLNHAGEFEGDVLITGTLSKTAGSFKIDHPVDPANKYLQHSFVESPDMMNVYNGNVVLDADGMATIALPSYFDALNSDFRYQLTCIGGFAPVYISREISGNEFAIAGGSPGLKVSWMVTGVRKDPYAMVHRIQVELDKTAGDKGKYLHPSLFGASAESAIGYSPMPPKPEDDAVRSEPINEIPTK